MIKKIAIAVIITTLAIVGILFIFSFQSAAVPVKSDKCPITGDGRNARMRCDDSLKNRPCVVGTVDNSVTLQSILDKGDDTKRFSTNQYASLVGYINLVKYGGSETCNCHSKDKGDLDTHIEISMNVGDEGKKSIICEITRYNRDPNLSYTNIKKLVGKKVKISGYLFFDFEHKQNAVNTTPNGTNLWRATCWELHPVCAVSIVDGQ